MSWADHDLSADIHLALRFVGEIGAYSFQSLRFMHAAPVSAPEPGSEPHHGVGHDRDAREESDARDHQPMEV
jgi:hypothetical protein